MQSRRRDLQPRQAGAAGGLSSRAMGDLPFDRSSFIRVMYGLNRAYAFTFQRLRVVNPCPLPRDGPAILVCNHISGLDPFLLQATCPRIIRWMMAKEYFDVPYTRSLCERLGYIPVARSGRDSASLKAGLRALKSGQILGIFPEGKINDGPGVLPFQPGVSLLALRGEAPVVPARLEMQHFHSMLYPALDPQRPRLTFGEPFVPSGGLEEATSEMHRSVVDLDRDRKRKRPVAKGLWF